MMTKGVRRRLWDDVPPAERMTTTELRLCAGAVDASWVKTRVRLLNARTPGCAAAAPFGNFERNRRQLWMRCAKPPAGQRFCSAHRMAPWRELLERLRRVLS